MFVDASAMIAIMTREPEGQALAETLDSARSPITSPLAVYETVLGLRRKNYSEVADAHANVLTFLADAKIQTVSITPADAASALDAFARFGKGNGHPAQLNLADCFAYAVARTHRTTLLFKGDDFSRTDIGKALRSAS